ncbi:MAG: hypothetical protein EPN22_16485 [Nitrospirae bacterium]|nr:MAG: hypothetical protein EPN22_16485 [Nitrospirota bacterium]
MQILIFTLIFTLFSSYAWPHPGKVDLRGGHKCRKNCAERGLETGEYHLHDKNWNPVRLDKDGQPLIIHPQTERPETEAASPSAATLPPVKNGNKTIPPPRITQHVEQPDYGLIWAALMTMPLLILLLLLLFMRNKKRERPDD